MTARAFRALRHRNFRLFFAGQSLSLIGTWMTRLATAWLVYRLTESPLLLGLVGFSGQIPTFLLAPFAGVWVDRCDRRRVLVVTQILASLQSLALAYLTLTEQITIPQILALSVFQGAINAFDMPARQSFMLQMVGERADLGNAIALNSSMVNLARLIGPSLAGITIALVGEGWCFFIDGISYVAVIGSLLAMRDYAKGNPPGTTPLLEQLFEGWSYVSGFLPIRTLMLLFAIISFMGVPYTVLLPVYAKEVLHGNAQTLGLMTGAVGVGALISAFRLAIRGSVVGLYPVIAFSAGLFGAGLIAFAHSRTLWLSLVLLVVSGFGMMQTFTSTSTVIQTIASEDKRGRVMSYWTMAHMGSAPFGSLVAGFLAPRLGVEWTLTLCGLGCIAGALWFWSKRATMRQAIRPIYEELGLLVPGE